MNSSINKIINFINNKNRESIMNLLISEYEKNTINDMIIIGSILSIMFFIKLGNFIPDDSIWLLSIYYSVASVLFMASVVVLMMLDYVKKLINTCMTGRRSYHIKSSDIKQVTELIDGQVKISIVFRFVMIVLIIPELIYLVYLIYKNKQVINLINEITVNSVFHHPINSE